MEGGIISPVHDAYGKKVHEHNYVKTAYMCYSLMWLHPVLHAERRPNKAAARGFKIDLHLVEQTAVKEVIYQPPPSLA